MEISLTLLFVGTVLALNKRAIRAFDRMRVFVPAFCLLILSAVGALADGSVSLLHTFAPLAPAGCYPWSTLIQAADGNFYGTAASGGPFGAGNIFQVTPSGILTPMYSFTK